LPPSPPQAGPAADRERFDSAAREFNGAQRFNAERPEARTTLANILAQRGLSAEAESEYHAALRLSPQYVVAAINLADPLRMRIPTLSRRPIFWRARPLPKSKAKNIMSALANYSISRRVYFIRLKC
jgi:tetratricopeptide (TPR) repeat protein